MSRNTGGLRPETRALLKKFKGPAAERPPYPWPLIILFALGYGAAWLQLHSNYLLVHGALCAPGQHPASDPIHVLLLLVGLFSCGS